MTGYETTANALAYTAYCLTLNPEKQAKVLAEIDAWGVDRTPSFEDLEDFPYLDAVLKESLRLFSPAALSVREAEADTVVGGYSIPKGTWIHVSWTFPLFWLLFRHKDAGIHFIDVVKVCRDLGP